MLTIEPATDFTAVREIIGEYARSTGVDLEFQGFSKELASLETYYVTILVARWNGELAGCVALRDDGNGACEMKRLYVRPAFRAHRIGRELAEAIVEEGRARGFAAMRLDTLPTMSSAMALYESLGFEDIPPYRYNPVAGTRFLEKKLR